jgi:hypothetical protein
MPIRSEQQEINSKGQGILQTFVANLGALNKFSDEDNGTDYEFELYGENKQSTGDQIHIQLKSSKKPLYYEEYLSFSIDIEHLENWLFKDQLPYFLIVIDVNANEGYWVHLQKYLMDNPYPANKDHKSTYTIKIPLINKLSLIGKFKEAIEETTSFMVTHKVKLEEYRLSRLNPGNKFKINIIDGVQNIEMEQGAPITVNIDDLFKGYDNAKRDFLIGKKATLQFEELPSSLKIPVLPAKAARYELRAWSGCEFEGLLHIRARSFDGEQKELSFYGKNRKGLKGMYFEGKQIAGPFKLRVEFDRCDEIKTCAQLYMPYNLLPWASFPTRLISEFGTVQSFFKIISQDKSSFCIEMISQELLFLTVPQPVYDEFRDSAYKILNLLRVIDELKEIGMALGIHPEIKELTVKTIRHVLAFHDIFVERKPLGPHIHFSLPLPPLSKTNDHLPENIQIIIKGMPLRIFDQQFVLDDELLFTEVKLKDEGKHYRLEVTSETKIIIGEKFISEFNLDKEKHEIHD